MKTRKNHLAEFKDKVALEAIREVMTLAEFVKMYSRITANRSSFQHIPPGASP